MKFADRLKFTATGTSAATITFGAAVSGFRTLAQAVSDGALVVGDTGVPFTIDDGAGNKETSLFTVTSTTVLTRTSVLSSSAGGTTAATFSGLSLSVFSSLPASFASRLPSVAVDGSGNVTGLLDNKGVAFSLGGSSVTPPSGDTTGAADLAAIQAALSANNRATLKPGGQYYLNGPITLSSGQHFTAYGAKLKLVAGVFGNIIRNAAVLPDRSASDGSFINPNNNSTVTSLTANFVAGDVGNMVSVFGASPGGAAWYGPITAVTTPANATAWTASTAKIAGNLGRPSSANGRLYQVTTAGTTDTTEPTWPTNNGDTVTDGTVTWTCLGASTGATLSKPGRLAITNAAVNVYYASSRNDNITIQGGDYEVTENLGGGHVTTSTFQNSFGCAFRRISNLRIKDTSWKTYGPVNAGGRFTMSIADFNNVTVDGTNFVTTAGDGVHLTGPGDSALVTNTRGTTGDDMVVSNCEDSNTPYITDTEGSLSNMTFRDSVAKNVGSRGFNVYNTGTVDRWTISNVLVENTSGVSFNPLLMISCAVNGLVIRKVTGGPNQAGVPLVNFTTQPGSGAGALIEDVTWINTLPASGGVVRIADPRGAFIVRNLRFNSNPAGTNYGLYLNGSLNGTGFGPPCVTLDGFSSGNDVSATYGPSPSDCTAFYTGYTTDSGAGDMTFNIKNCYNRGTTGYVLLVSNVTNIARCNISDTQGQGTAMVSIVAGNHSPFITMTNVKSTVPLLLTAAAATLETSNCDFAVSGAALVQITGNGALFAKLSNTTQTGNGVLVTRAATQYVRVRGTDIPVDQTLLTPQDGDMIYNSNATPANGTGVAMYNTAAAKWKNLYSGVTN